MTAPTARTLPRSASLLTLVVVVLGIGSGWDGGCSVSIVEGGGDREPYRR